MTNDSTSDDDFEAITSHRDFPFANWEVDERLFALTARYWSCFVRQAIGPAADEWQAEFEVERDGNPILTLAFPGRRRALRVVLLAPLGGADANADADIPARDFYPCLNIGRLADGETEVDELLLFARTGAARGFQSPGSEGPFWSRRRRSVKLDGLK